MAGGVVMRVLGKIFGEETLQSILSALPNTYVICPQCEYILKNRKSKIAENVILCYFGIFYYYKIVNFCTFYEDIDFDQRRCLDETGDSMDDSMHTWAN